MTSIISSQNPASELQQAIENLKPNKIFIIADSNTSQLCLPSLKEECKAVHDAILITIPAGEENKSLSTAQTIWQELEKGNATRNSLIIALGGGMITDLGGFAAAIFKRGVHIFYIPTTLLGAADAAVGGKTAINFNGLKNELGVFRNPDKVFISPLFFKSLSEQQFLSGYAEMIKMAFLFNPEMLLEMLSADPTKIRESTLLQQLDYCVNKKLQITTEDLYDHGPRRLLNFGHTAGHAFEALCNSRNQAVDHGTCVAYGILYALILSHLKIKLPTSHIYQFNNFLHQNYTALPIGCADTQKVCELMSHDKKNNDSSHTSFILLQSPGNPIADCQCTTAEITTAFELFNDLR